MKNKTFLSSEEIVESFLNYLDDTIYNYAYMLDGSWGSGKTFFVKEILVPSIVQHEKEKQIKNLEYEVKRVLYVSLYGIKDTEEISRLLYIELRKILTEELTKDKTPDLAKDKKARIASWIGTGAKILADVVKDSKGIDIERIFDKISTGFSLKNCIFIFDDLERTSCNINDVLGYINNFIEHDGIKTLLIANEAEVNTVSQLDINPMELLVCLQDNVNFDSIDSDRGKGAYNGYNMSEIKSQDKISLEKLMRRVEVLFARNLAYKQIKEKVVGETVKYQPLYFAMIKKLTENNLNNNEELKNIILCKAEKINEIAMHYEHFNLRTFLFFLSKMIIIYDCLKEYVEIVEKMLDYVFLICVKYKSGNKIDEWEEKNLFESRSLYGNLDFRNVCIAFRFVDDFVLYGKFDIAEIIKTVSLYVSIEKRNAENENDPAKQIQNWWSMEEETLKKLMGEILVKMESNNYSFDSYLHILNNFVSLVSIGFDESYLAQLMEYMKNNIRHSSEKIELRRLHSSFAGDKDRELYALKVKELNEEVETKNNSFKEDELSDLLADVTLWGIKISTYVREHRNMANNGFIYKMDPEKILVMIKDGNTENIEEFRYALSDFYSFSNIAEFYMEDYSNLKIIHDGLNPDNPKFDLVKKVTVKWLKELIAEKMDLLKPMTVE